MARSSQRRETKVTDAKKKPVSKPSPSKRRAPGATRKAALTATIARDLASLTKHPDSPKHIARVQQDIDRYGVAAVARAMKQTPAGKRLAKERLRKPSPATQPPMASATPAPTAGAAVSFGLIPTAGDVGQVRQVWQNTIGSLVSQPLCLFRPTTLEELRSVIRQAEACGCKVKAAGSGHSFTDVALTADFLIDTHGLDQPLALERDVLKGGIATGVLFETEGGILVRHLNEALWDAGLGLLNMGGYDGQTLMGVVSTSTHGSGITFGPLSGFVRSMTIVVSGARVMRIEPADGITDAAKWSAAHPDIELVQDDDCFNACQVGIGCMGVVYSVVLDVRDRYWMKEQRTLSTWSRVKQDLSAGQVLADNRHYEVLVNPYVTNGDHTCLVTRRNPVPEPATSAKQLPQRNVLLELFAKVPRSGALLLGLINAVPELVPSLIDSAMQGLARDYVDRSYRVFNIGAANDVPAYGSEIGFPVEQCITATERILRVAADGQRIGKAYLSSPFSLRFVKASPAFMSMMHDADTCMIEFPMLDNTIGGKELLRRIESEMYALGGRPHWGLLNFIAGGDGLVRSMYPRFDAWLAVRQQLDPHGTFDNAFTDRCGISKHTFVRN